VLKFVTKNLPREGFASKLVALDGVTFSSFSMLAKLSSERSEAEIFDGACFFFGALGKIIVLKHPLLIL